MTGFLLFGWGILLFCMFLALVFFDLGIPRFLGWLQDLHYRAQNRKHLRTIHQEWEKEYEARNGKP